MAAGDGAAGLPGIDMSFVFTAILTGDTENEIIDIGNEIENDTHTNNSASSALELELSMEVTGNFTIGNHDFEAGDYTRSR